MHISVVCFSEWPFWGFFFSW